MQNNLHPLLSYIARHCVKILRIDHEGDGGMKLLIGSSDIARLFNIKELNPEDRARYLAHKNLQESLDFKTSRALLSLHGKGERYCISHKNGNAAVAFYAKGVGVDMEEIKPRKNLIDLFGFFANEEEEAFFYTLDAQNQLLFFYELFTLKEALIKLKNSDFFNIKQEVASEVHYSLDFHIACNTYEESIIYQQHQAILLGLQTRDLSRCKFAAKFFVCKIKATEYMICCVAKNQNIMATPERFELP